MLMRFLTLVCLGLLCGSLFAQFPHTQRLEQLYPDLLSQYQYLHQHPELSFYEKETSAYLAKEMRALGWEVTEKVGGYGVVAVLENGEGPNILVRTDTDALPVAEQTGLPYASTVTTTDESGKTVSVMHACGHDMHMTVWNGTAALLTQLKNQWKGTLVFIAQPAEERAGGAKAMLEDGLYKRFPVPDYALALHVSASLPAGTIGYCPQYAMANVNMVNITVHGQGGHGAYPHTTKDPVVLASQIILNLQTIVSREISPLEPAVVTVGSIHGGTKGNIISDEVKLELTLRSYSDEVRQALIDKIRRICDGQAQAAGLPPELYPEVEVLDEETPSVYNDPALTDRLAKAYVAALGEEKVQTLSPVMGGEDFARYGRTPEQVPIHLFWLGTIPPEKAARAQAGEIELPSLHSPYYAPQPKPSIRTGVKTMSAAVLELLGEE